LNLSIIYQHKSYWRGNFDTSKLHKTWVKTPQATYQTQHRNPCHYKNKIRKIDFNTATNKLIISFRLIGPPKDWASAQWFIKGNEESIYGRLFKNNMDGLSSFYPVVEGIDYLVNSDTEVALFHFENLHSFQEYQCKVFNNLNKNYFKDPAVGTQQCF
jgi:hypothetical protein